MTRIGDRAAVEDIVADTMTLMWQRWEELGGPDDEVHGFPQMRVYAYRTARFKMLELTRWRRLTEPLGSIDPESAVFATHSNASHSAEEQDTLRIIRALPERQRRALALRMLGYEDREVAQVLGIGEGTVRSHLATARRKLHEYLTFA
jgi:RNA polymerase sigma factor (sigma-70 family)